MVERLITPPENVIDFSRYQKERVAGRMPAISARRCRFCDATLSEGEREEECSSAFNVNAAKLRWQAAQILRGLI
jgi:hypothetical protein